RSISNWVSMYGCSDIGIEFAPISAGSTIFDDPDNMWEHSPLAYANNFKTPTLIIHSDMDYRCPISEGYQLYTALKHKGVEARMVVFKGENHELSRSGKPAHRLRRLTEITNWFEKHCR
ncbi:MAG: prolyl oligopeptidase family serine peptidase, partial [Firmicutes bacterium]|nr:prolyl oligopeptidase family serine peptidase [Bacillota bacterium]